MFNLTWCRTASINNYCAKCCIINGPHWLLHRYSDHMIGGIAECLVCRIRCQNAIRKWYSNAEHNLCNRYLYRFDAWIMEKLINLHVPITWMDQQALILSKMSLRWSCIRLKCLTNSAVFQSFKMNGSIFNSVRKWTLNVNNWLPLNH